MPGKNDAKYHHPDNPKQGYRAEAITQVNPAKSQNQCNDGGGYDRSDDGYGQSFRIFFRGIHVIKI